MPAETFGVPHGVYKGGVGVNTCAYTHTYLFLKPELKYLIVAVGEFSAPSPGQVLTAVT